MKKAVSILLSVLMLISIIGVFASAASLKDGMYKVPLSMIKADEEKESLAAKFLESFCYMEVKGGKKTLYIPLREEIKNPMMGTMSEEDKAKVEFFYYVDGTIDKENGKTSPCQKLEGVTVDGTKHTYVFKVPMVLENDIGLLFKAPGMPSFVTPAARLRLDMTKAAPCGKIAVGSDVPETKAPEATKAPEVTNAPQNNAVTEATKVPDATDAVTEAPQATEPVVNNDVTVGATEPTTEEATEAATEESGKSPVGTIAIVVVVWLLIAIIVTVIVTVLYNKKYPGIPVQAEKKDDNK